MLEDDLGHEGAGLQIPAALELEEVALRADDRPGREPFEQPGRFPRGLRLRRRLARHARTIYHNRLTRAMCVRRAARAWRDRPTKGRSPAAARRRPAWRADGWARDESPAPIAISLL